jgi:putative SOS response-associated peptidase YedK
MTDCSGEIRLVHDGMPLLLHTDKWYRWLHGSFNDARRFRRGVPDHLIAMHGLANFERSGMLRDNQDETLASIKMRLRLGLSA